jgi:hypothetical protein
MIDDSEAAAVAAALPREELRRRQSRAALANGVLWFMRLGILAMLAVVLAFFYVRYHKSDEQIDLIRYVEIDLPALDRVEAPLVDRLESLLDEKHRPPAEVRSELAGELMPGLVRLRKLSEAPLGAARTPPVKALAAEYRETVEALIESCRAALRVIDDPKLDAREGLQQVRSAIRTAAEKNRAWRQHVAATRDLLHLAPPSAQKL